MAVGKILLLIPSSKVTRMNCGGFLTGAPFDAHLQSGNWQDEGQLYPENWEYANATKR